MRSQTLMACFISVLSRNKRKKAYPPSPQSNCLKINRVLSKVIPASQHAGLPDARAIPLDIPFLLWYSLVEKCATHFSTKGKRQRSIGTRSSSRGGGRGGK